MHGAPRAVAIDQFRTVDAERLVRRLGLLDAAAFDGVLRTLREMFGQ